MRVFPVIALVAAAVFVALGFWQLDRLDQRRSRNAAVRARMAHPPVALRSDAVPADSLPFRRARVRGVFDLERQVIVVARSRRGVPGVHVVTPLRRPDGPAILVERGWVPSPDGKTVRLSALAEPETTAVVGVLLAPPERRRLATGDTTWPRYVRAPAPAVLAAALPYALAPLVLRRTTLPPGAPEGFRALAPPQLGPGPHLSYAIQWFAFAVIAVVGSIAWIRKETKAG